MTVANTCFIINLYNLWGSNPRSGFVFDSRWCDIIFFFQIKSVQTTSSSKGDMSYLHEGKKKEHYRERERESLQNL